MSSKDEICKYFQSGKCRHGDQCKFSHVIVADSSQSVEAKQVVPKGKGKQQNNTPNNTGNGKAGSKSNRSPKVNDNKTASSSENIQAPPPINVQQEQEGCGSGEKAASSNVKPPVAWGSTIPSSIIAPTAGRPDSSFASKLKGTSGSSGGGSSAGMNNGDNTPTRTYSAPPSQDQQQAPITVPFKTTMQYGSTPPNVSKNNSNQIKEVIEGDESLSSSASTSNKGKSATKSTTSAPVARSWASMAAGTSHQKEKVEEEKTSKVETSEVSSSSSSSNKATNDATPQTTNVEEVGGSNKVPREMNTKNDEVDVTPQTSVNVANDVEKKNQTGETQSQEHDHKTNVNDNVDNQNNNTQQQQQRGSSRSPGSNESAGGGGGGGYAGKGKGKTQYCYYWNKATCAKGDQCPFIHAAPPEGEEIQWTGKGKGKGSSSPRIGGKGKGGGKGNNISHHHPNQRNNINDQYSDVPNQRQQQQQQQQLQQQMAYAQMMQQHGMQAFGGGVIPTNPRTPGSATGPVHQLQQQQMMQYAQQMMAAQQQQQYVTQQMNAMSLGGGGGIVNQIPQQAGVNPVLGAPVSPSAMMGGMGLITTTPPVSGASSVDSGQGSVGRLSGQGIVTGGPPPLIVPEYDNSLVFSVDVECVATGPQHHDRAIAQIGMVDCYGRMRLNVLVKPDKPVHSYLTPLTGLTKEKLDNYGQSEEVALAMLRQALPRNSILVGMNIRKDIDWLKLEVDKDYAACIDLADLFRVWNTEKGNYTYYGLDHISHCWLNVPHTGPGGHDAVVDAFHSMSLFNSYRTVQHSPQVLQELQMKTLSSPVQPSFAKMNPTYEGCCMGNRKTCTCGAPFYG